MPRLDRRRSNPRPANVVGERAKGFRAERGLSQAECAALVQEAVSRIYPEYAYKIDQSDMSRIENGRRTVTDYELRSLAIVLSVSADALLGLSDGAPVGDTGSDAR